MKRVPMLRVTGLLLLVAGCTPALQQPTPDVRFDPAEARYAEARGRNIIAGRARVTLDNGQVASCAGNHATLVPVTRYTRARLARIYGHGNVADFATAPHLPRDPAFDRVVISARCDGGGAFRFDAVADGPWFVVAPLRAPGQGAEEGASVRRQVTVRGGQTVTVTLTE